ncbi:hypothetical protein KUTeg_013078 [Tegillarca granosa]|uniref:C2H2-type domain-containing protein n=1 Tax=Tegillarca granosa TaxID=220873 RepID=A0ABQ9ET22_TEGGR|nr:hypothetical protein KUTeg_013078 [Tegillarca granosa]
MNVKAVTAPTPHSVAQYNGIKSYIHILRNKSAEMEVQIKQEPDDYNGESLYMDCQNETYSENYSDIVVKTECPEEENQQDFENSVDDNESNTVYTITINRRKGYPKKLNPQLYTQKNDVSDEEDETNLTHNVSVDDKVPASSRKTQKIVDKIGEDTTLNCDSEPEDDTVSVEGVSEYSELVSAKIEESLNDTETVMKTITNNAFPSRRDMNKHLKTHSDLRPHVCKLCGKGFKRADSLTEHEYRHSGEQPHVCDLCGKGFYNVHKLKKHLLAHDGPDQMSRCIQCNNICGKGFAQASNLKSHESKHVGKPFSCDVCGKSFAQQTSLKAHSKRHTNQTLKSYDESEATDWFMMQATKLDDNLTTNDTKTF